MINGRQLLTWLVISTFVAFQFFLQTSTAPMFNHLLGDFHISGAEVAVIASSFFYTYVSMQILVGLLLDRYNQRIILSLACALLAIGCFWFSQTHSLLFAILSRMLMGLGASFAFVGMLTIVRHNFSIKHFAIMVAACELLSLLMTALGNSLLSYLILHQGWRWPMLMFAIFAALIAVCLALILRSPNDAHIAKQTQKTSLRADLQIVFTHRQVWLSGLYGGFMMTVINVFTALWGVPFLQHVYHLNIIWSTSIVMATLFGVGCGSLIYGYLTKHVNCSRLMQWGALLTLVFMLLFIYKINLSIVSLYSFSLLMGLASATYLLTFTHVKNHIAHQIQSTAMGFANLLIMGMPIILQPLIGILLGLSHHHQVGAHDYRRALVVLPLAITAALVLSCFLRHKEENSDKLLVDVIQP